MRLRLLLPNQIFADKADVLSIVADSSEGSFGLLPQRLDCATALVPGILTYVTKQDGAVYVAVDEGVLVKTGADVRVSVRHAVGGKDLAGLHDAVKRQFLALDDEQRQVKVAVAKMEGGILRRFAEFQDGK
jgi:F-type H+-transporting ATPase subunit epsilon